MLDSRFDIRPLRHADTPLPLLIEAREPGLELAVCLPALRALIEQQLLVAGGVLLRGFEVQTAERFRSFATGFGSDLLTYEFGSTPRSNVT
ncbi:TauD/TfdA family dioxygenase, partial [Pseudomonas fragi]|nr:TauD/TfdA family dioxygenase [Pseudomonas sp. GC01]